MYFPQDDDAETVRRCRAGDAAAFGTLVERYERVLFSVALRMLGNAADASDATQTAFLKAFERLDAYDPAHKFFSWMYRILANECLNQLRARRLQDPVTPELRQDGGPYAAMEARERRAAVHAALLGLTPEYREVVVLRHFGGLSYEEIAAATGVPSRTVKSRLYTARQQLGATLLGWT